MCTIILENEPKRLMNYSNISDILSIDTNGRGNYKIMININAGSRFQSGVVPQKESSENDLYFTFHNSRMLVKNEKGRLGIPTEGELKELGVHILRSHFIGAIDERNAYSVELADDILSLENMTFQELRPMLSVMDDEVFKMVSRAFQIAEWDKTNSYCGKCGTPTEIKKGEFAKVCPKCGYLSYPRISPAIIVAVVKEGRILLAHNNNFCNGMYSVIAGFVEPGETFEECVSREVYEEVGIKVSNIRYFGSQPWPFPHSLMVGFTAEHCDGEIAADGVEIADAGWFEPISLPVIPSKGSIAHRLIDWFIEKYS